MFTFVVRWPSSAFNLPPGDINLAQLGCIDLKRIARCKLALIVTSADHRKFLGLFGSEAARL